MYIETILYVDHIISACTGHMCTTYIIHILYSIVHICPAHADISATRRPYYMKYTYVLYIYYIYYAPVREALRKYRPSRPRGPLRTKPMRLTKPTLLTKAATN